MHVSSELMVQINQKGVYGVDNPLPRSFSGSIDEGMEANQKCTILWYKKLMLGFEMAKFSK